MNMKKIWLVVPSLGNGGAEKIVFYLASLIDKTQFKCTVIVLYGRSSVDPIYEAFVQENSPNLHFQFLNKKGGFDLKAVMKLRQLIKQEKPDIIHSHLSAVLYIGLAVGRTSNIRCLHTVHTLADTELPKAIRIACKWFYRTKRIQPIAIGQVVKESLEQEYGLQPSYIPVIYNGVDVSRYQVEPRNREEPPFIIVNVAGLRPPKNHKLLIHAIAEIPEHFDYKVYLLGDGELREECEAEVRRLGLSDRISFEGAVDNVPDYLARANCFALSSDYEGFSLAMVEALCAQLPIVSTRSGGSVELVQDGVNGYLVDVGDAKQLSLAIRKLMSDPQLAREFGKKSLELSKKFDVKTMVRSYEDLYQ